MQRLDDLCLLLSTDIDPPDGFPCLTVVDPNRKVPDLYFKVVDPKLQVSDLKAEVGELRSGGIPHNLTPADDVVMYAIGHIRPHSVIVTNSAIPSFITRVLAS